MKMTFKSIMIAALAVTFTLASCSKTEEQGGNGDDRRVNIKIADGSTRATGSHVEDASAVTFTSGHLLFTNTGGTITKSLTITDDAAVPTPTSVGINALKAVGGATIENVPGTTQKVYFVGNSPAGFPVIVDGTTNISTVTNMAIAVDSQYKADGTVDNVSIYGTSLIVPAGADYEAKFQVSPIAARMEIGKITAGGTIKSYKVEGIFINNYYTSMNLGGTSIAVPADNSTTIANYTAGAGSYTGVNGGVFDYAAIGIGTFVGGQSLVLSPKVAVDVDDVWAYNLLALSAASASPTITVRISDVVINDGSGDDPLTYAGTWFLSITNMYDSGTAIPITFAQRNVYRIVDLSFTENDLTDKPFLKTKKVAVEVTMLPWISADIDYDFD